MPGGLSLGFVQQSEPALKDTFKNDFYVGAALSNGHVNGNDQAPIRGRTRCPLLLDRQYKPKPAFQAVLQTAGSSWIFLMAIDPGKARL
jgi:hypothetical protein